MDSSVTPVSLIRSLLRLAPGFLDSSARATGAFARERKIPDAMTLLLMLLAHVASDYSFKDTAALFHGAPRLPSLCASALYERFVKGGVWFSALLSHALTGCAEGPAEGGRWIRLVDASVVNGPGSKGTDRRIHVLADQASGRILAVRVEDASVGESASLHPLSGDAMFIFDRGYSHAPNIHAVLAAGGGFTVRVAPQSILICDGDSRRLDLVRLAARVPSSGVMEMRVRVPLRPRGRTCAGWHLTKGIRFVDARLIGTALPGGAVMWLLADTVSSASAAEIAAIYRFRWQIELLFKRLKSLTEIDELKSSKGPSARPWILAKLLLAALAQRLVRPAGPVGASSPEPGREDHRHSAWSRFRVAYDAVCQVILGDLRLRLALSEENLIRLINTPRKRRQQPPLAPIRVR